jgi:YVTN family beta-propeller protein
MKVVDTVRVGSRPVGLAVDVHDRVFVTNSGDDTVSVIDSRTNTVTTTIVVGSCPERVATDTQFGVVVANADAGPVTAIDKSNTVKGTVQIRFPPPILDSPLIPFEMMSVATDHFLSRAYLTDRGQNRISIIPISGELPDVATQFINLGGPFGVAVDSLDHRVYVTQPDLNAVSVMDAPTNEVIATIPVRERPRSRQPQLLTPCRRRCWQHRDDCYEAPLRHLEAGSRLGLRHSRYLSSYRSILSIRRIGRQRGRSGADRRGRRSLR